jgi:hypothetical protein
LVGDEGFCRLPLYFFDDVPAEGLKLMNRFRPLMGVGLVLAFMATRAEAVTVPFSEDFATDSAKWKDTASTDLNWSSRGGPDGGSFVSASEVFKGQSLSMGLIVFRGQDFFDSSNHAFVGNWLTAGVDRLTAYVRQNTGQPLSFFARVATQSNFPGVTVQLPTVVPSNTWTKLEFDLSLANPLVIPEGGPGTYQAVLGAVGNVQIGVGNLSAFANDPATYTFDLDKIAIGVPEPGGLLLMAIGAICGLVVWRRRNG